jgi:ubiquinone biosynthesis protein UbiJ
MPDTFIESTFKGRDVCKIYTGEYMGESQYLTMGLKKAQAVLENIDALRRWVDRQENPHGHKD